MEDIQDFGNQTETETIETNETVDADSTETQVETDTIPEEPKGIKVKYMKEETFVPDTDIPTYVQKGLNHDRLQQQLEQTKQQAAYLDRLATMSGYGNTQEFLQAVEQAEQQRQIEQEATRMGVDPSTYQQYFQPVNQRLQAYEQELQSLRQNESVRQIENEINGLKQKYPDFDNYIMPASELVLTGQVRNLEMAYQLASYQDKLSNLSKQTEQQVLAQVTGRNGKQVLPSTDKPSNNKFDPTSMSLKDVEEISKRVARGERITF